MAVTGGTSLIIASSSIQGNLAFSAGGGVSAQGSATSVSLSVTSITANYAGPTSSAAQALFSSSSSAAPPGGLAPSSGAQWLPGAESDGGDQEGAAATGDGGGVWASSGASVTVGESGRLLGNACARHGGGAWVGGPASSLTFLRGSEASNNTAGQGGGAAAVVRAGGLFADGAAFRHNSAISGVRALPRPPALGGGETAASSLPSPCSCDGFAAAATYPRVLPCSGGAAGPLALRNDLIRHLPASHTPPPADCRRPFCVAALSTGGFAYLSTAEDALSVRLSAVTFERNSAGLGGLFATANLVLAASPDTIRNVSKARRSGGGRGRSVQSQNHKRSADLGRNTNPPRRPLSATPAPPPRAPPPPRPLRAGTAPFWPCPRPPPPCPRRPQSRSTAPSLPESASWTGSRKRCAAHHGCCLAALVPLPYAYIARPTKRWVARLPRHPCPPAAAQQVAEYSTTTIVTVACWFWLPPNTTTTFAGGVAPAAQKPQQQPGACPAGALLGGAPAALAAPDRVPSDGPIAVVYTNFSGQFDLLRLRGSPGGTFTLRFAFSSAGWPPLSVDPVYSGPIRMQECLCAPATPRAAVVIRQQPPLGCAAAAILAPATTHED